MDANERADRARARMIYNLALARGELTDPLSRRRMAEMRQLAEKEARQESERHMALPQIRRYSRGELLSAHRIIRQIYQQPFDEAKHRRVPAGQPNGGEFVAMDQAEVPPRELVVPKDLQPLALKFRRQFAELDNGTTAELQDFLHTHTQALLEATDENEAAFQQQWIDRISELLAARNYSDDNAPLHIKQRAWAAQKKFMELLLEKRYIEKALSKPGRNASLTWALDARRKLAEVQQEMKEVSRIGGSSIPVDSPVRLWSFERKFVRAAEIALSSGNLAPEIAEKLAAAISAENIARAGAMVAALAALHISPVVGLAADLALLTAGGVDAGLLAHRLYLEINLISDEADLHAAAHVLEQELTSKAAEELFGLLLRGAVKGGKNFHKKYHIEYAPEKVRAIGRGEMMFSPNIWNVLPLKIRRRLTKNQVEHNKMLANQQHELKKAIKDAPQDQQASVRGTILNKQGVDYQALSHETLKNIPDAEVSQNKAIGIGEGSEIDHVIKKGGRTVYVESKFTIQDLNQRTINQLTNAVQAAKPGDKVILDVARDPTPAERRKLRDALGAQVFDKIKITVSQIELFTEVQKALQ